MNSNNTDKLRVVLVEDEDLFRDLLRISLEREGRAEVVGAFPDAESALEEAPAFRPHVALLDIELQGGMNGIRLGHLLRRRLPELGVVLLSNHDDPALLASCPIGEGGWSYLLKPSVGNVDTLHRAIKGTAGGMVILDPQLVTDHPPRSDGPLAPLPARQQEIFSLIAQGLSNRAIAARLNLAVRTVENQINRIYHALGINTDDPAQQPRVQAVLRYLREIGG